MLSRVVARIAAATTHTKPTRVFLEMGRHPRLFRWWLPFAGALMARGDLPREDRELLILRTAHNCNSRYEWTHHAHLARRAGLRADQVAAAAASNGPDGTLSERQLLLVRAADELHDRRDFRPTTAAALRALLSDRERIELCLVVGHYEMLAMVLNTGRVEPEPAALALLSRRDVALAPRRERDARTRARLRG